MDLSNFHSQTNTDDLYSLNTIFNGDTTLGNATTITTTATINVMPHIVDIPDLAYGVIQKELSQFSDEQRKKFQRLYDGTPEDVDILIEILKDKTIYTFKLIYEIKKNDGAQIWNILNDYSNRNVRTLNLTKNIL